MESRERGSLALAISAAFAVICAIFVVVVIGLSIEHSHEVAHKLCQANVNNRTAIRQTWLSAEKLAIHPGMSENQIMRINAYFNSVLKPIPPLECVNNNPVPKEGN